MATERASHNRRNRLLAQLAPDDQALLQPHLDEVSLKVGTLLHEVGSPVKYVYFPYNGMISLLAVMRDGQAIETATVGSEGVVGATAGFGTRAAFTRAVVQAPMLAARVSAAKLRSVIRNGNGLRHLLLSYNEVLLAQVQQTAACNALHPMEARLARWLLQTQDRVESNALPLTQEFLSQMLGVQRTTVNLIARQLEKAGVILNRRGRIVVVDRQGLEEVACECYAVVRDQLAAALPKTVS